MDVGGKMRLVTIQSLGWKKKSTRIGEYASFQKEATA